MMIVNVYPNDLIEKAAEELKKVDAIKPPVWASYVKTGTHKARAPVELDWWYMRAAAILRTIQLVGPIGVSKLRIKYGGKKRRGHKPPHFKKGSGSIIRKVLQQLEKAELIKFAEKGVHKGRIITPKGRAFLHKIAKGLVPKMPKPVKKEKPKKEKPEEKVEEKKVEEKPKEKTKVEAPKPEAKEEPKPVPKPASESEKGLEKAETSPKAEELIKKTKESFKEGEVIKEKQPTAERLIEEAKNE